MRRFLPKSLIGQIALVMAAALLVAQAINFGLVFNERQRATHTQIEAPAIGRFVMMLQRLTPLSPAARADLLAERGRRGRFAIDGQSSVPALASDARIVGRLRDQAEQNGVALRDARAAVRDEAELPRRLRDRLSPQELNRAEERMRHMQTLHLSAQLPDGSWVNARLVTPRPNPWLAARLAGSTLLIYLLILAAVTLIAIRLGRPLRALTAATQSFAGRGQTLPVEPRGPADVRHAILAFNAMSARVGTMLDEKDRMLGAIGHDLRTPLASLRIRAESIEPAEERAKMIATIAEMTTMLDDTLAFARSGRASEEVRVVDVSALADAVVEELRALGQAVRFHEGARKTASVQPNLLRRAVRNLIDNGVKYGGSAEVAVRAGDGMIAIEVADNGPGIPEAEFGKVQEPFVRLEASRNRATGGSGLGLALARAAAEAHGGRLELENRPEGGLLARILLPS
ncbi:MAG TPA: HAMP domain-containing sensor histidine kinase [Allosphingosinicella sp.]|nr:HAMP domain-containing sensor histidine kinase [Allosphingosinicella sp.]